jgi:hypothetical protein
MDVPLAKRCGVRLSFATVEREDVLTRRTEVDRCVIGRPVRAVERGVQRSDGDGTRAGRGLALRVAPRPFVSSGRHDDHATGRRVIDRCTQEVE